MCGIVAYIGPKEAKEVLINGLKQLEYRGYDSSGMAIMNNKSVQCIRAVGKVKELEPKIKDRLNGHIGIAHTRWATHGGVTEENAHPHYGGDIWLVHNGIIENYSKLKKILIKEGAKFNSQTDTEVLAHLINKFYKGNLLEAVKQALSLVQGTYGITVMHKDNPDSIIVAKNGSPLVLGIGQGEST